MKTFTETLDEIRKNMLRHGEYFILPSEGKGIKPKYEHINNGFCGVFSSAVCSIYGQQVQVCCSGDLLELNDHDLAFSKSLPDHYFLKYEGKYYDAECIEGVSDYMELPLFGGKKRWWKRWLDKI